MCVAMRIKIISTNLLPPIFNTSENRLDPSPWGVKKKNQISEEERRDEMRREEMRREEKRREEKRREEKRREEKRREERNRDEVGGKRGSKKK